MSEETLLQKIMDAMRKLRVSRLVVRLKDKDSGVRERAAEALVKIGAPAVPELIELLGDADELVRREAVLVLGKIGAPAVPALTEALKNTGASVRSFAAYALGRIGEVGKEAVPTLLEMLKDTDGNVRMLAAESLGKIGDDKAIPLLFAAAAKHSELRETVGESIREITERSKRPSGVRQVDERPKDFRDVVRNMALGIGTGQRMARMGR